MYRVLLKFTLHLLFSAMHAEAALIFIFDEKGSNRLNGRMYNFGRNIGPSKNEAWEQDNIWEHDIYIDTQSLIFISIGHLF